MRNVRERLPEADLLYLADQGRVPYGDKSDAELRRYLTENVAFLETSGASAIVMGCNTTCAVAARYGWPAAHVPILDLIESAALAVAATGATRIGVIATAATIRSGAYAAAIHAHVEGAHVTELAAPALVPLVEAGKLEGDEPAAAVAAACENFPRNLDVLILACTHYPLLDAHFAKVMGPQVTRVDPAIVQSARTCALPQAAESASGATKLITSAAPGPFERAVRALLPEQMLRDAEFASWTPPELAAR